MIVQPRYNPKLPETFPTSKDFYQFQHFKPTTIQKHQQKLEQLSFSQRQKNNNAFNQSVQSETLSTYQTKLIRNEPRNNQFQTTLANFVHQQDFIHSSLLRHQQSLQEDQQLKKSQQMEPETQQKKLPPLKLVAEKMSIKEKLTQSKEKTDDKEFSYKQSVARKYRKPPQIQTDQKQEQDLQQLGRTSSTPFMQKAKEVNLTSRSQSPAPHALTPKSPLKIRKKVKQIPQTMPQNQKKSEKKQCQKPIKLLENFDKKITIKKKKQQNPSVLQSQQQQQQKEKMTQRHTSYRCFINEINFSNNQCITCPNKMEIPAYYYYVGKGNNASLIKNIFRQRWWWQEIDSLDITKLNMGWTQLKQLICITQLPQFVQNDYLTTNNNESFIASREETIGDTSDSEIDFKQKSQLNNTKKNQKKPQNYFALKRVMNSYDLAKVLNFMEDTNNYDCQLIFSDCTEKLLKDIKQFYTTQKTNSQQNIMHNHMEDSYHLGNKKALFYNMRNYFQIIKEDYTKYIPITFHIQKGLDDEQYNVFLEYFKKRIEDIKIMEQTKYAEFKSYEKRDRKSKLPTNLWIIKPGEATNRGNGITVCSDLNEINKILTDSIEDGRARTYIVQQYIDNPLLYNKRKFDIRCYMLLTSQNGIFKGYWYTDGYIRTSSKEFTTKCLNKYIHLTNDAIQLKDEDYGKFESGNKISFIEFQRYLDANYPQQKFNFFFDIYPKMKAIALDMIKASYGKIDPFRRTNSFELFGLDFMIDDNFKLWLIEANTNPCLELSCPLLSRIIPAMVENVFRIAVDPIFPPPYFEEWPQNKKLFIPDNVLENNKFELIFDEQVERKHMIALFKDVKIEQDIFEIEEEEEEND